MRSMKPKPPLDCADAVRSLWEYLDRRAEPESVEAIEDHLARCDGCRAFADFEQRLVDALSSLRGRHGDPARLRKDVLRVLRKAGLDDRGTCNAGEPR